MTQHSSKEKSCSLYGGLSMERLVGEVIRYLRINRGMSQDKLSEGICSKKYIGNVEKGKNLPSLYVITRLSERLRTDLLSALAAVVDYTDISTFLECEKLKEGVLYKEYNMVKKMISSCENKKAYQKGEAKKLILFCKAALCMTGNMIGDARIFVEEGLRLAGIDHSKIDSFSCHDFSDIDFHFLLLEAIESIKRGKVREGSELIDSIKILLKEKMGCLLFSNDTKRKQYQYIVGMCIFQECFFNVKKEEKLLIDIEEFVLEQSKNGYIHMIPELLLCKSDILMRQGKKIESLETYNTSRYISKLYYKENEMSICNPGKSLEVYQTKTSSLF